MKLKLFTFVVILAVIVVLCLYLTGKKPARQVNAGMIGFSNSVNFVQGKAEVFSLVVDTNLGTRAVVFSDKKVVVFENATKEVAWATNVVDMLSSVSILGPREITSVKMVGTQIVVNIGMHTYVGIEPKTGSASFLGSD